MRIYTGTGGKVLGSVEAGEVIELEETSSYDNRKRVQDEAPYQLLVGMKLGHIYDDIFYDFALDIEEAKNQGYTDQKYAIEILDFRVEDYQIGQYNELFASEVMMKWCNMEQVKHAPRLYTYVCMRNNGQLAILMPIKQEQYDMIVNGEKGYIFMNRKVRALFE